MKIAGSIRRVFRGIWNFRQVQVALEKLQAVFGNLQENGFPATYIIFDPKLGENVGIFKIISLFDYKTKIQLLKKPGTFHCHFACGRHSQSSSMGREGGWVTEVFRLQVSKQMIYNKFMFDVIINKKFDREEQQQLLNPWNTTWNLFNTWYENKK